MKFKDLVFDSRDRRLSRSRAKFKNGYEASVITGYFAYGGEDGLYELAVLYRGKLVYDTPITDDVIGCLSPSGVDRLLARIEALPARNSEDAA